MKLAGQKLTHSMLVFTDCLQAESLKKRGSVKSETSLSAVEMSGKVIKRGYLLKQVNTRS